MKFHSSPLLLQKLPAWRVRALLGVFMLGFIAMAGRAFYLQVVEKKFLLGEGQARFERVLDIPATRGLVRDRYGNILALSTPVRSVWAAPDQIELSEAQTKSLARMLEMPEKELNRLLRSGGKGGKDFVYLSRQMDPQNIRPIIDGEYPGVYTDQEYRRYYPMGEVAAQIVGFTGVDGTGLEGVELLMDKELKGQVGRRRVIRDRRGNIVEDVQFLRMPQNGNDITLSIDNRIQFSAFQNLKTAVETQRARSGAVVVVDVKNGEILAMANWPSYNPNRRAGLSGPALRNRALTDEFEPGSTFKPFTVALALEKGVYTPKSLINTDNGKLTLSRFTITDTSRHGVLTVAQVVQKSSNVGMAKIARQLRDQDVWQTLHDLGFGNQTGLRFPGETPGRLLPWQKWSGIERMTVSYGYGVSTNLLQLTRAYLSFARQGDIPHLTLLRDEKVEEGPTVFKPETVEAMRDILEKVTEDGGTGARARVPGVQIAGKTGTANILKGGSYSDETIASFVGFAPAHNPQLLVAVMIENPQQGRFGGEAAAPVFSRVMADSLSALRQMPVRQQVVANNSTAPAELQQAMVREPKGLSQR